MGSTKIIRKTSSIDPYSLTPAQDTLNGSAGSDPRFARGDHSHPFDTDAKKVSDLLKVNASNVSGISLLLPGASLYRNTLTKLGATVSLSALIHNAQNLAYDISVASIATDYRPDRDIMIFGYAVVAINNASQIVETIIHDTNLLSNVPTEDNKAINANGAVITRNGLYVSDFIYVKPNSIYKISANLGSTSYVNAVYASDKTTLVATFPSNDANSQFTIPYDGNYLRISNNMNNKNSTTLKETESIVRENTQTIGEIIPTPIVISSTGAIKAYYPNGSPTCYQLYFNCTYGTRIS